MQLDNKQNSVNKKKDQVNELFNRLRKEEVLVGELEEKAVYLERSAHIVEQDEGTTSAGLRKRNISLQLEKTSKQRIAMESYVSNIFTSLHTSHLVHLHGDLLHTLFPFLAMIKCLAKHLQAYANKAC